MPPLCHLLLVALLVGTDPSVRVAEPAVPPGMARIPGGLFRPLFRDSGRTDAPVKSFCLEILPVTNGDFLEFVRANPAWRRSQVKRPFADENYLKHWAADLEPGAAAKLDQPVVWISWYAADAYARWRGMRLATVAEWELAAAASPTSSREKEAYEREMLDWYATPTPAELPVVGRGMTNRWGVRDLHGLVWEWVSDFNPPVAANDARTKADRGRELFCGGGALGARDVASYPEFLRYGFRSSLKPDYCLHNLGFRCAKDLRTELPKNYPSSPL